MEFKQIRYEVDNAVATVTLLRPDKMNALTPTMRSELIEILGLADMDDSVSVIVVTGEGKPFCAGWDLSSGGTAFHRNRQNGRDVTIVEHRDGGGQIALAVFKCRKPVFAAINGHAIGVGITMTLPMDIRIVSQDAKIGFVFTRRGIVPEACSTWFLPRLVGVSKSAELIYTGRVFRASAEAKSGLFNYVVPQDRVLPKSLEIADEIAKNTSAVAVALSKALLWHGLVEDDPHSVHLIDSRCIYWAGLQKDAFEGTQSFVDKRSPEFTMKVSTDMPDFYPWWKEPKV